MYFQLIHHCHIQLPQDHRVTRWFTSHIRSRVDRRRQIRVRGLEQTRQRQQGDSDQRHQETEYLVDHRTCGGLRLLRLKRHNRIPRKSKTRSTDRHQVSRRRLVRLVVESFFKLFRVMLTKVDSLLGLFYCFRF